jgi:hypothetical protein
MTSHNHTKRPDHQPQDKVVALHAKSRASESPPVFVGQPLYVQIKDLLRDDIEEAIFLSDRIYVMTARPGRVKAEMKIDLLRPRKPEMMESPEFQAMVRSTKGLIRDESLAAMGGDGRRIVGWRIDRPEKDGRSRNGRT